MLVTLMLSRFHIPTYIFFSRYQYQPVKFKENDKAIRPGMAQKTKAVGPTVLMGDSLSN